MKPSRFHSHWLAAFACHGATVDNHVHCVVYFAAIPHTEHACGYSRREKPDLLLCVHASEILYYCVTVFIFYHTVISVGLWMCLCKLMIRFASNSNFSFYVSSFMAARYTAETGWDVWCRRTCFWAHIFLNIDTK